MTDVDKKGHKRMFTTTKRIVTSPLNITSISNAVITQKGKRKTAQQITPSKTTTGIRKLRKEEDKSTSTQKPETNIRKKEIKGESEKKTYDMKQHNMLDTEKQQQTINMANHTAQLITGECTQTSNIRESAHPPTAIDTTEIELTAPMNPDNSIHTDSQVQQERNKIPNQGTTETDRLDVSYSSEDRQQHQLINTENKSQDNKQTKKFSWLMRTISTIISTPSQKMKRHKCKFKNNRQAAQQNGKWLKHYKWDLEFA